MEDSQVVDLIMFVKGIWSDQATSDPTIAAWIEVPGRSSLSPQAIHAAVIRRARAGLERPTPGQIYQEAAMIEHEAAERARYSRKAIGYEIPEQERARANAILRDIVAKLGARLGGDGNG